MVPRPYLHLILAPVSRSPKREYDDRERARAGDHAHEDVNADAHAHADPVRERGDARAETSR